MEKYDINWLEKEFIHHGLGHWFERNKLEFLVKWSCESSEKAVAAQEVLLISRQEERRFASYQEFEQLMDKVLEELKQHEEEEFRFETR